MTERPTNEERLSALRAARQAMDAGTELGAPTKASTSAPPPVPRRTSTGPKPARIVAAAASVSAGIGLVALMAGAQQDIVVQVNPAAVTVQPQNIVVELRSADGSTTSVQDVPQVEVRAVEAAVPAERPAPQARVVSQSEGS